MRPFSRLGGALAWLVLAAALLLSALPAPGFAQARGAQGGAVRVEAVEVELVAREAAVVPGKPLTLGLRILHDPHWHTYWRNPGDSGLATQLELSLPAGFAAGPIQWPAPERLFIPPLANYGYEGEIVLPLQVAVPASIDGDSVRLAGKAFWLMCRDVCIPGEAELSLALPVARGAAPPPSRHAALFEAARARMPAAALPVSVSVDGDRMSIGFDDALASAEFFPYREGLLAHAEPQALFELPAAGRPARRLEVRLSAEGAQAAADPAARQAAAEGIVVSGDKVFELKPVAASSPLAGGTEIFRVAGAPASAAPAGGGFQLPGLGGPGAASTGAPVISLPGGAAGPGNQASASGAGVPAAGLTPMNLLVAAVFAAIGGLILNLMPCVFPVIGLKVLGFARHGGGGDAAHAQAARGASRAGAFAFSAGVVVSFWLLAGLLLALRAAGQAAGWGFQLQSPVFVAAMALLFVAIALNFSGVWEFGAAMTRLGQYDPASRGAPAERPGAGGGSPLLGSFGSGALAVLVATPCTAPFMGSALGFTLSATALETLVVFTALGLGMALPYLLLGLFPAWLRWLPRPGRWMESFRQALAFPMYATAAWLAWVLGQQAGIDAVLALAIGAVLVGFAAWLYGRFVQQAAPARVDPAAARRRRVVAASLAVLSLAGGLLVAWPDDDVATGGQGASGGSAVPAAVSDAAAWHTWSAQAVAEARAAGRPVFVDFTAAWCVSCQVNKKLVLNGDTVVEAMHRAGVLRLKADWTNRDPEITAELARHGRNGVPLYLVYLPGAEQPLVLPELLTNGIVLDALAGKGRSG
ncbi:thioredoxin family protein [Burkholderiaceae bacterium FT117]|uniref:protein-disulfide reductase DsbD family protein n=1 Tax=Zeimonas sediminis TaxID=2944268 RepID=UPI002342C4FB|nr:thioredoxin family protein [Zeimonas sediminis]MCM5572207.1 thioredoxin family protein [Zeimonas sediminis]